MALQLSRIAAPLPTSALDAMLAMTDDPHTLASLSCRRELSGSRLLAEIARAPDHTLNAVGRRSDLEPEAALAILARRPHLGATIGRYCENPATMLIIAEHFIATGDSASWKELRPRLETTLAADDLDALFTRLLDQEAMTLPAGVRTDTITTAISHGNDARLRHILTSYPTVLDAEQYRVLCDRWLSRALLSLRERNTDMDSELGELTYTSAQGRPSLPASLRTALGALNDAGLLGRRHSYWRGVLLSVDNSSRLYDLWDRGEIDAALRLLDASCAQWPNNSAEHWRFRLGIVGDRRLTTEQAQRVASMLANHSEELLALRSWDHDFVIERLVRRPESIVLLDVDTAKAVAIAALNRFATEELHFPTTDVTNRYLELADNSERDSLTMAVYRATVVSNQHLAKHVATYLGTLDQREAATAIALWDTAPAALPFREFAQMVSAISSSGEPTPVQLVATQNR